MSLYLACPDYMLTDEGRSWSPLHASPPDQLRSLILPQKSDLLGPIPTSYKLAKVSLDAENTEQSTALTTFLRVAESLTCTASVPARQRS